MNHDFCGGCNHGSLLPLCAIEKAPNNAYIEKILNGEPLSQIENFVCHKASQDFSSGKLTILSKCDDCGLCQIICPNNKIDYTTFFTSKLERVIFNDYGKTSLLFQSIFPDSTVATEVQVQGNYRTKRIDLVIKKDSDIYLIKMLKSTDKVPFYMRSYNEVISQYQPKYSEITFHSLCLIPASKKNDIIRFNADIVDLITLNSLIWGKL